MFGEMKLSAIYNSNLIEFNYFKPLHPMQNDQYVGNPDEPQSVTNKSSKILRKTAFTPWHEVSESEAICYAKWKFYQITNGRNDNEILSMVNDHFNGITFTLNDLAK